MEAYFLEDKRIIEWVDLIIEKLLTFSLLKNEELSINDLEEVSQAITNLSRTLQKITPLSPEALTDAINQLIKQRLPEDKLMNHFTDFYEYLNKFLNHNAEYPLQLSSIDDFREVVTPDKDTSKTHVGEGSTTESSITESSITESNITENDTVKRYNADESNATEDNNLPKSTEIGQSPDLSSAHNESTPVDALPIGNLNSEEQKSKIAQKICPPDCKVKLQNVLRQFYPSAKINWNFDLAGYSFLAQIDDLLVYLTDHADDEIHQISKDLAAQGWKVFCCSAEDLRFPRRLERNIKAVLRSSKIKVIYR